MAPVPLEVANIIRQKKHKYGILVDGHRFDEMASVILPNAQMIFLDPSGQPTKLGKRTTAYDSLEAYCTGIGKLTADGQTHHIFGYGDLEMTGPNEVTAVFSMRDTFVMGGGLIWSDGCGHYYETWTREGDDWFMASLRLQRSNVRTSLVYKLANWIIAGAAVVGIDLSP